MDLQLGGKNAAVTGATRGIGRAIANTFASEGCNISICAREDSAIDSVVSELRDKSVKVLGTALDVTDSKAQKSWLDKTAETLGGLDILIANVSAMNLGTDENAWKQSFKTDMMATFFGVESASPYLKQSESGAMVFISSIAALHSPGEPKPYGAMKAAVINYAKGLARSLAPYGVRVNSVSPGNIYSEDGVWGSIERDNLEFFNKQIESNPMGRMGTPEEVARAVVFLASPVSSFISGTNLIVDGALTVGVQY